MNGSVPSVVGSRFSGDQLCDAEFTGLGAASGNCIGSFEIFTHNDEGANDALDGALVF